MFKKMLVALDGSDHARKALDTALDLAGQCNAHLVLFHAVKAGYLAPGYAAIASASAREVYQKVAEEQTEVILGEAEQIARKQGHDDVSRLSANADSAAAAIVKTAKEEHIELVVVGTRGMTGLREITIGSVAHRVTAAACCPVLVVR